MTALRSFILAFSVGVALVVAGGVAHGAVTTRPIADGSIADANGDGAGDFTVDGVNSVLVGFNTVLGPGVYRGVYEFDLGQLPSCAGGLSATLHLSLTGTHLDGSDPNLTLYAGPGDGSLGLDDFASGDLVTTFSAFDAAPFNILDVSATLETLIETGVRFASFVVRPNPEASATSGAFLYSSNEISDMFGFQPTLLEASCFNPCAEITGNGTLRTNPGARFDLAARYKRRTQTFEGQVTYADRCAALRFQSSEITSIDNIGDTATITGSGLANGLPVSFQVTVSDVPPGLFSIQLSNGYLAEGVLKKGTIHISDQC